jgi:hypothetical protein
MKSIQYSSERTNHIIKELGLNPVYIFENLGSEDSKRIILNKVKGLSGIYMILNKTTKDYYIGSGSTNKLYARFSNHLIYFTGSKIVKLAVKKYDLKNFAFLVLELYPNIVTKENNKELLDLEDKYLKLLLPNYNILTEAGSSFGYKHTEIDRQKIKDVYSIERRERIANSNRYPLLNTITKNCNTNIRPIVLYNLNKTVYGMYYNILEAAQSINCDEKTLIKALKTEKGLVKKE